MSWCVSKCISKLATLHFLLGHKNFWRNFFQTNKKICEIVMMSQIEIECRILKRAGTKFALDKLIKKFFLTILTWFLKFFSSFFPGKKLFREILQLQYKVDPNEFSMRKQVCQHRRSYLLIREGFLAKRIYSIYDHMCLWYLSASCLNWSDGYFFCEFIAKIMLQISQLIFK